MQRVAVTELARVMGQSGDLKRRDFSLLRGVDGIRAHQRKQADREEGFRSEVALESRWKSVRLHGRVDGVIESAEGVCLEEYKTTRNPEKEVADPNPVHVLQLQVYGWMWERAFGVRPELVLMYLTPSGLEAELPVTPNVEIEKILEAFLEQRLEHQIWVEKRNAALRSLSFPFEKLRPGQQEFMNAVANTFRDQRILIAEAPTGIGKTLAVLVPALRSLGEEKVASLFVATCRNTGKNTVEDALKQVVSSLPGLRAITLQAKDRICREAGTPCDCEQCPLAKGFYDRLPDGLAALRKEPLWDVEARNRVADRYTLCPYAFCMAAAREADVIVGDINYAMDPSARLEFLFSDLAGEVGLIVDEAHHLPERCRGMLSASLSPSRLRSALREMGAEHRNLVQRDVNRVIRGIQTYLKENLEQNGWPREDSHPPEGVARSCRILLETLEASLADTPPGESDPRIPMFQELQAFQAAGSNSGEGHVPYAEHKSLYWFCRDPAAWIQEKLTEVAAVVLFSATLEPLSAYRRETGLGSEADDLTLPSPFDPERFRVRVETSVSLAYKDRSPETFSRLSELLTGLLSESRKNTLVFFPSYTLMNEVASRLPPADLILGPVRLQPRGLQEEAAREFLAPFFASPHSGAVFAVLGGALNEGIDLPGEALQRVIVVSVGYPAVCMERELLREGFALSGEDGFHLAYELPGLIRIRQALGRVIRGPEDSGEAVLVDARFCRPIYTSLNPGR